jgi:hypothetical protein
MRALVIAALMVAGPAFADAEFRAGTTIVRLQEAPCTHPLVLALMNPAMRDKAMAGYLSIDGRMVQFCWVTDGQSVHILDEEGDGGTIPAAAFKPAPGV